VTSPEALVLGIDFDNTIVCYDRVFPAAVVEQGLLPRGLAATKKEVRDELRRSGREDAWTELQGHVYGPAMERAEPFPGVEDFFRRCRRTGTRVAIISHRTRHPYLGPRHDLHAAALGWLEGKGFLSALEGWGLARDAVFFELTKEAKLARVAAVGCTHFVDDLPELLAEPGFPPGVERVLFDPLGQHEGETRFARKGSWTELSELFLNGVGR
jgi:hypothetical protein